MSGGRAEQKPLTAPKQYERQRKHHEHETTHPILVQMLRCRVNHLPYRVIYIRLLPIWVIARMK